ncbi:uncharacterized protein EDB91DRAFT_302656 [Suillus paluster]|uniref:uncharacterized protein n=1 Tax=Suillus paluster TaxID=48578 RepID=UPI001B87D112|nr:uncharacterized protein EDB91DRAFT_302656 [Suillus paluster]KAG1721082.1 hypothetical protein EDB91DRAFT_302656 [Suillus paluster]
MECCCEFLERLASTTFCWTQMRFSMYAHVYKHHLFVFTLHLMLMLHDVLYNDPRMLIEYPGVFSTINEIVLTYVVSVTSSFFLTVISVLCTTPSLPLLRTPPFVGWKLSYWPLFIVLPHPICPSRYIPVDWARNIFPGTRCRQNGEGIDSQTFVDVLYAQGQRVCCFHASLMFQLHLISYREMLARERNGGLIC